MAQGNLYQVIPEADYEKAPPIKTQDKYEYTEPTFDKDGNQTGTKTVKPTWKQLAEKQQSKFGKAIRYNYAGSNYYVIEFEGSFLKQEVQPLLDKQGALPFPAYRILTAEEARKFVRGNLTDADEV